MFHNTKLRAHSLLNNFVYCENCETLLRWIDFSSCCTQTAWPIALIFDIVIGHTGTNEQQKCINQSFSLAFRITKFSALFWQKVLLHYVDYFQKHTWRSRKRCRTMEIDFYQWHFPTVIVLSNLYFNAKVFLMVYVWQASKTALNLHTNGMDR